MCHVCGLGLTFFFFRDRRDFIRERKDFILKNNASYFPCQFYNNGYVSA